jgi:hypothetical protein
VLVVWNPNDVAAIGSLAPAALPMIAIGFMSAAADFSCDVTAESLRVALQDVRPLIDRHRLLHADLSAANALTADGLLAFLAVRGGALSPTVSPSTPDVMDFRERSRFPTLEALADTLAGESLLERRLAERINLCSVCRSARLLVREVCPACGSPDVDDRRVLHHFVCAYQAPEAAFRGGGDGDLTCPKCSKPLGHPSTDYEVSAAVSVCAACGETAGEPVIGYRCLDCGHSGGGNALQRRTISAYRVTLAGYARAGLPAHLTTPAA